MMVQGYNSWWGIYQLRCVVMQAKILHNCFYNVTPCRLHINIIRLFLCLPLIQMYFFLCFFFFFYLLSSFSLPLRYDVTQGEWVRCNVHIQKTCHYPVFGLKEGTLYQFRVRAVNKAGAGRPSKATEPVLTADPLEHTRTMGNS